MNFKSYFNSLEINKQIQLYLIPILVLFFLYINFNTNNTNIKTITQNDKNNIYKEIEKYKRKINNLEDKKIKSSKLDTIHSYEILANKFNVGILDLKSNKNILTIKYTGKFKNTISYLNAIDKISDIKSFEIINKDKKTNINLVVDIKNYKSIKYISTNIKQNLFNPFVYIKHKNKKDNVKAILGDFVFLNGKWYKLNDRYKKSTIVKITKNYVVLKGKNKTTILKVFENE